MYKVKAPNKNYNGISAGVHFVNGEAITDKSIDWFEKKGYKVELIEDEDAKEAEKAKKAEELKKAKEAEKAEKAKKAEEAKSAEDAKKAKEAEDAKSAEDDGKDK